MKAQTLAQDMPEVGEHAPHTLDLESPRKRFLLNSLSNAGLSAVQVAANLWLTPFLIGHLGISVFGMIPLVTSVASYTLILTGALNTALSRFLVIDLERGDAQAANRTFNTALFTLVGIVLALGPLVLVLSLTFPALFDVPPGWEVDASWLFALVAVSSFITIIASAFNVSPVIHSKFLSINIVNLVGLLARIGFIAALFSLLPTRLWYAGGGALIAAVITLLGSALLWHKLTPELHVRVTAFDRSRLQSLVGMGGWVIVNTLGGLLLARTDLIVVNAFFGTTLTGGYGSVAQFSVLMGFLADAVATVIRPVILIRYAQQDHVGLQHLSSQSIKLLGLGLALPAGLLCGFSRPILSAWLGPEYQYLSPLLIIIVAHQSLNLSVRPLLYVQAAYNKLRWPSIATLMSGGAGLGLGVLLAMWGKWGAAGVAVAVAVAWTAKNALYMPIYTAHIMKLRWWTFLPKLLPSVIGTLFVGMVSYGSTIVQMPRSWLPLAGYIAVVSLIYAGVVWIFGLSSANRQFVRDLLPGGIGNTSATAS